MPIVVKNYSWNQTENIVTIRVPLKGIHHSKVNIFYSERYLKANYEQFFFEVILLNSIIVEESKCTLTATDMVFELIKVEQLLWSTLEPVDLSKKERMDLKLKLMNQEYENIQKKDKEIERKKAELKRVAVQEQIKIENQIKDNIELLKKKEKEEALGNVDEWKAYLNSKSNKMIRKKKKQFEKYLSQHASPEVEVFDPDMEKDEEKILPLPRTSQQIEVDFTERVFPTPIRESKTEEENEWLKKQTEARRSVGFLSEDIRAEEKNPQFLLRKGDEFMRNQNYLGAISAYSFGIKLSDKFIDLYIARSRAHYEQGNYQKTALDCSTALELMVPKVEANLKERADCIGRRGMALCKLKMLSKGIDELEISLKLQPNAEYKEFLKEAEKEWMNNSDSD